MSSANKIIYNTFMKKPTQLSPPGLGDYLRGCVYLYKLQQKLGFTLKVDVFHHPIGKYLENPPGEENLATTTTECLVWWNSRYSGEAIEKMLTTSSTNSSFYITKAWYDYFHTNTINSDERAFFQDLLKPSPAIKSLVDTYVPTTPFTLLHVRCGDDQLVKGVANTTETTKFLNILHDNLTKITENPVFLITDSPPFKEAATKQFGFSSTPYKPSHSGLVNNDLEGTVVEFFIMARATKIICLSSYSWISTFSTMCSAMYNIPIETLTDITTCGNQCMKNCRFTKHT